MYRGCIPQLWCDATVAAVHGAASGAAQHRTAVLVACAVLCIDHLMSYHRNAVITRVQSCLAGCGCLTCGGAPSAASLLLALPHKFALSATNVTFCLGRWYRRHVRASQTCGPGWPPAASSTRTWWTPPVCTWASEAAPVEPLDCGWRHSAGPIIKNRATSQRQRLVFQAAAA